MKVKELIDKLKDFKVDSVVSIEGPDGWGITDKVHVQLVPVKTFVNKASAAGEHDRVVRGRETGNGERVLIYRGDPPAPISQEYIEDSSGTFEGITGLSARNNFNV